MRIPSLTIKDDRDTYNKLYSEIF